VRSRTLLTVTRTSLRVCKATNGVENTERERAPYGAISPVLAAQLEGSAEPPQHPHRQSDR
jgi:hypothetical protein